MSQAHYRIRQAAALSGVSADTIRIWERRYAAVSPRRDASNIRQYAEADIQRLQLMARLTAAGERIGDIAQLPEAALRARLQVLPLASHAKSGTQAAPPAAAAAAAAGVAQQLLWLGPEGGLQSGLLEQADFTLSAQLPDETELADWLRRAAQSREGASPDAAAAVDGLAVVVNAPQLTPERAASLLAALTQAGVATGALLIYDFAPRSALRGLLDAGVICLRRPGEPAELAAVLRLQRSARGAAGEAQAPAARFAAPLLEQVRQRPSPLSCECPRHLADLIGALAAFEDYSAQCESANANDAALHASLRASAGHARHTVESALLRLAAQEGWADELETPAAQ